MYIIDKESKTVEGKEFQSTPELSSSEKEKTLFLPNNYGSLKYSCIT